MPNRIPLAECTKVSPTAGPLGCFQDLAIRNKAAINICGQLSVWACLHLLCVIIKEFDCWVEVYEVV